MRLRHLELTPNFAMRNAIMVRRVTPSAPDESASVQYEWVNTTLKMRPATVRARRVHTCPLRCQKVAATPCQHAREGLVRPDAPRMRVASGAHACALHAADHCSQ